MEVRDAVEADAERLADLTDAPVDVMGNLVHDRTVRVAAVSDATDPDGPDHDDATGADRDDSGHTDRDDADASEDRVVAFVSFDARQDTVHVTQFDGSPGACERLLEEPVRFARTEGMAVELLVGEARGDLRAAAEAVGFERAGSGPAFEGTPTVRYRRES